MENEHISEGLDEWAEIQPPSPLNRAQLYKGDNSVIIRDGFFSGSEVFPPSNHQGLSIASPLEKQLNEVQQLLCSSSSSSSLSSDGDANGKGEQENAKDKSGSWITTGLGCLRYKIIVVGSQMRNYAVSKARKWLFASATTGLGVFLFVLLLCMRVQRRRRQAQLENKQDLRILIKEKDQKITELLLQIARLTDMLLARRRVPVLRAS